MATLTLKYPRYPKRMVTIAEEVRDHVESVRTQRIAALERAQRLPFAGPTKTCRGYERDPHELPLMAEYFHYRKRKNSRHSGNWNPLCRGCNKAKRDAERAARGAV
jgi:hypothetical protein